MSLRRLRAAATAALATLGIGCSPTFATERAGIAPGDAAAIDGILSAAGKAPADLAVLSADEWGRGSSAAIVVVDTRVTHLRFRDAGLTTLAAVAPLDALTDLDLRGNRLAAIDGLGGARALRRLFLGRNQLVTLGGLDACDRLEQLYVEDNLLPTLAGLAPLPALFELVADRNQLTTLDGLAGRASLVGLHVSRNRLASLDGVRELPALTTLVASDNAITRIDGLDGVPKLRNLIVSGNRIVDATPLAGLPGLAWVDLTGNPVTTMPELSAEVKGVTQATAPAPAGGGATDDAQVAALPGGGGSLSVSRSGTQTRGSLGFSAKGTITRVSGVAFLELNSRSSMSTAARAFVLELRTGAEPVRVYSAGLGGGFRARLVPARTTARLDGALVGGGVRALGVWIEAVDGAASGIAFDARSP